MKNKYEKAIIIPDGIECSYRDDILSCKKAGKELSRKIYAPRTEMKIEDNKIIMKSNKSNKNNIKIIMSNAAHIMNMFKGLDNDFVYKMEVCHVHFPITVKVEGNRVIISNFLGEKKNRTAHICDGVKVEVKGKDITVSGHDIEKTGQTAANIEKSTTIVGRDRRVFQDGIFITHKNAEDSE